jgi:hypothetical protein
MLGVRIVAVPGALMFGASVAHSQSPHPPARWDGKPDGRKWTASAHASVSALRSKLVSRVPNDVAAYCPAYQGLDAQRRRAFWVYLMSSLAVFESNHRPELTFKEPFKDSQGNWVISRGLLQISRESANGSRTATASRRLPSCISLRSTLPAESGSWPSGSGTTGCWRAASPRAGEGWPATGARSKDLTEESRWRPGCDSSPTASRPDHLASGGPRRASMTSSASTTASKVSSVEA